MKHIELLFFRDTVAKILPKEEQTFFYKLYRQHFFRSSKETNPSPPPQDVKWSVSYESPQITSGTTLLSAKD